MICKHVDIIAVSALLIGLAIYSHVREVIVWNLMKQRPAITIDHVVRIPSPPPMPSLILQ